jgi:hypothetical protein
MQNAFCRANQFPKYPVLIPKTDYTGFTFSKRGRKPCISSGPKLKQALGLQKSTFGDNST